MKKTITFLKTFLVAAGLLVGGANAVYAKNYTGSVSFAALSRITNNGNGTFTTASNAGNGYALALADLSGLENIASATSVTLEFDVTIASGGRLLIGIGDKNTRGTTANGSSKSTYNTDGLVMRYGTSDGSSVRVNGGTNNSNLFNTSSHVTFTLDRTTGKYSYTITYVDGGSVIQTGFSSSNISTTVSNATVVEAYSWVNSQTFAISDVSYSYEYTPESFNYTVTAIDSESHELRTLASGTSEESVTVSYPRAIKVGEVWYTCPSTNNFSVEVSSLSKNPTITYIADPSIVYFKEAEEITASQNIESASCSGGKYVHYYGGTTSVTISVAGTYELETNVASRNTNSSLEVYTADGTESVAAIAKNGSLGIRTCQFTADAGTMRVGGPYYNDKFQNSLGFDYVLIRIKKASATIGEKGYTTFASQYAIDLSSLPDGLTAYYVESEKINKAQNYVKLTEVAEAVAAGTGLLLEGTASKSYDFIVVASGRDLSATNKMVGCPTATDITKDTENYENFYVMVNGATEPEFQNLKNYLDNNEKVTIPAGKAYLDATGVDAARLSIVFDDNETTGISDVRSKTEDVRGFYDLQGRRVAQPTKGLYIVSGKKYFVK